MGKHGPCCHCGVTSTPLWRNGPPEKPILCNACGSRWRTKGSLTNYTPMHARELLGSVEVKALKVKSVQFKPREQKVQKKNQTTDGLVKVEPEMPYCDQNFKKILEEDTSNRSSSGSAISFSEHFGTTEASDLTGSVQSNVWESLVPSKKRTCLARPKPSAVEKLTKDLYSIWHEQQSSYLSGSSEEDLLYESETPFPSDEIGHGGVLIRHPNSKITEDESEASSISTENKLNEAYSGLACFPMHSQSKVPSSSHVIRPQKSRAQMLEDNAKRDKPSDEIIQIVRNKESPLRSTDLKDVLSFEVFMTHLTQEEQQKLMRYLPSVDTTNPPESLKSLFCGSQFVENCSYYQQLLAEGVFDLSFVGVDVEECRILKRLVLLDLTKSKWVERYKGLKEIKCKTKKDKVGGIETMKEPCISGYSSMTPLKRFSDDQSNKVQEAKGAMRSPKRVCKSGGMNFSSAKPPLKNHGSISKAGPNMDEFVDNEASCFNVRNIFVSPADRSSMLGSLQFTDDIDSSNSDQDLLLDAPSNAPMMEAELLCQPWKLKT